MTCTCEKAQTRKLRVLSKRIRRLDQSLNWLYFLLGAGTTFVVAVGAALLALHELKQRGL